MAKHSVILRNKNRILLTKKYYNLRKKLKYKLKKSKNINFHIVKQLSQRKRNESYIRIRHRCNICGRSNGNLRKFGLCRIHVRKLAMKGEIPGLKKSSW